MDAVDVFGWPSRGRGDFGRENNEVERRMIAHWGEAHRAFLRGRYVYFKQSNPEPSEIMWQLNTQCAH